MHAAAARAALMVALLPLLLPLLQLTWLLQFRAKRMKRYDWSMLSRSGRSMADSPRRASFFVDSVVFSFGLRNDVGKASYVILLESSPTTPIPLCFSFGPRNVGKVLYLAAEMENVRAIAKRDAEGARLYAVQKFAKQVLHARNTYS